MYKPTIKPGNRRATRDIILEQAFKLFLLNVEEAYWRAKDTNWEFTYEVADGTDVVITADDVMYHTELIALANAIGLDCYIKGGYNSVIIRVYWNPIAE